MVEISVLIGVIGVALSVGTFFIGRTTAAKASGVADGEMKANVGHIKTIVEKQDKKLDRIVEDYEDIRVELESLKGRLQALEQKVAYLHGGE